MKHLCSVALITLLVSGCASQIMESYIDQSLTQPVLKYGPPANAFDMGDGRRAFTWTRSSTIVLPGQSTTYGTASATAFGNTAYGSYYGTTIYQPPVAHDLTCAYTVFAKRTRIDIEGPAAWTIVGYQKPELMCE